MVSKPGVPDAGPQTLAQAHDMLLLKRPSKDAPRVTWLRYYRRSAAVYAAVAQIDRDHYHEALSWAAGERNKATAVQVEMAEARDKPLIETVKEGPLKPGTKSTVHKEQ